MTTPTGLFPRELELRFLHRFYGSVLDRPLENVFGMTQGANAGFGFRLPLLPGLEIKVTAATGDREIQAGASYAYVFTEVPVAVQLDAQYFHQPSGGGLYTSVSAQTEPLLGIFSPALSVGFDTHHLLMGFAAGLVADIGPTFSLFGEIYPLLPQGFTVRGELGSLMAFAAGIKLRTGGHQFMILLSNTSGIGQRRLQTGAFPTGLHLGFNILRKFWF
jgi:hypothetical protein